MNTRVDKVEGFTEMSKKIEFVWPFTCKGDDPQTAVLVCERCGHRIPINGRMSVPVPDKCDQCGLGVMGRENGEGWREVAPPSIGPVIEWEDDDSPNDLDERFKGTNIPALVLERHSE